MDAAAEAFQNQKLIRHDNLKWLILSQGVVILPLLIRLPLWLWFVWGVATFWRWQIYKGRQSFPGGLLKGCLGAGCVAGLLASYNGSISIESMIGFLVCAFILKLLEIRSRKDGLLLLFIGFIAVAAQFLLAQTFLTAMYACFSCIVLIAAWQTIYFTREFSVGYKLKAGTQLLLHAMPLMVVMFVVMPRIAPLWRVPMAEGAGATGFSETLSPGDLGRLVQSTGTAFRVTFPDGNEPLPQDMYWRGLVLYNFDGRTWSLDQHWDIAQGQTVERRGIKGQFKYDVMLEPHQYTWLFSLAEPVNAVAPGQNIMITHNGLLTTARDKVITRMQYTAESLPLDSYPWKALPESEKQKLLFLPKNINPEAQQLAGQWVLENLTTEQKIQRALNFFRTDFYYTLEPPMLGRHSVDEFLFKTQRGFCEHFSSSFAFLMRASNVPARVVVGYQGGTYNDLENYWVVSQADAHAWVEVWVEGQGWRRVDPTSAVAPERIELGINQALPDNELSRVASGRFDAPQWMTALRQRMDAAGYVWNRWVLGYDSRRQNEFLSRWLGGVEPWRIGVGFIGIAALILIIYALMVIRPQWRRQSKLQRALLRFDKVTRQKGLLRQPGESIAAFCARLAEDVPEWAAPSKLLGKLSERALYADDQRCLDKLQHALSRFPNV